MQTHQIQINEEYRSEDEPEHMDNILVEKKFKLTEYIYEFHHRNIQGTFIISISDYCFFKFDNIVPKNQEILYKVTILNIPNYECNLVSKANGALQAINLENVLLDNNQDVKGTLQ